LFGALLLAAQKSTDGLARSVVAGFENGCPWSAPVHVPICNARNARVLVHRM